MPAQSNPQALKVDNYILPPAGQRMRTAFVTLDFATIKSYEIDMSYAENLGAEMVVQSLSVDNVNNNAAVEIVVDKTLKYTRTIKTGDFKVLNVPATDPSYLLINSTGTGKVSIFLHNFPSLPDSQL